MAMKWCDEHWTGLRKSIEDAGMAHLIARGGAAAAQRLKDELAGTATEATFDPLMAAWARIDACFLKPLGPGAALHYMAVPENVCTLCELARMNPQSPEIVTNWVGGSTRDVRAHCVEIGLLK